MKKFLWFCIRAELVLLAVALYWHHYIPVLVPSTHWDPSESHYDIGDETSPHYHDKTEGIAKIGRVHVWCREDPCTLVASVKARASYEEPFVEMFNIVNPTADGQVWGGPPGEYVRVDVVGLASGQIGVTID